MAGHRLRRRRGRRALPKTWGGLAVLLAAAAVLAALASFVNRDEAVQVPVEAVPTTLDLPAGVTLSDLQRVRVEGVIDGDTIDVSIDGRTQRVRYYGIDTPERGDRCYRDATDRNRALIDSAVLLLPDERDKDRNGRLLRYIFTADGKSVDATLVAEGYARAWREDGRYRDQLINIEAAADEANRGCLWAE